MSGLRLRPVRIEDEQAFLVAHRSLRETDDFLFGLHYQESMVWQDYRHLAREQGSGSGCSRRFGA